MGNILELTGRCSEGTLVDVELGGFKYQLDYPLDIKGYDPKGTVPGGYLVVALAGCKVMVARMYLMGRGKEDVSVNIKITADFDKDEQKKFCADFKTELSFEGDISEEDIRKIEHMLDDQCAVEHVLKSGNNTFETTYKIKE